MWAASSSKALRALAANHALSSSAVITSRGLSNGHPLRRPAPPASQTRPEGNGSFGLESHSSNSNSNDDGERTNHDQHSKRSKAAANPTNKLRSWQQKGLTFAHGYNGPRSMHRGKQGVSDHAKPGNKGAHDPRNRGASSNGQTWARRSGTTGEQSRRLASSDRKDEPHTTSSEGKEAIMETQEGACMKEVSEEVSKQVSEEVSEEAKPPLEDPVALVQHQLRAFFAQNKLPSPSVSSTEPTTFQSTPSLEEIAGSVKPQHPLPIASMDGEDNNTSPVQQSDTESPQQTEPRFSRPTLSDLEKVEADQFAGIYRSETVWDPQKDYVLMQDGPERSSYLETAIQAGARQYIVVIIDGDNLLFDPRHMNQGYEGGKFVAQELRLRIARKHRLIPGRLDLRIRLFCAQHPLATVLNGERVVRKDILSDFFQGIVDASPHNYLVNVGKGAQAADLRVKAALADALRDPGCFRAYLGGLDDFGYKEELNAIKTMGLLESKVNLIQVPGYAVESRAYHEYAHRAIDLDYLFKRLEVALKDMQRYDKVAFDTKNVVAFDTKDVVAKSTTTQPCVFYHLTKMGCTHGDSCKHSHDPIPIQEKHQLARILKQRKCPTVARGRVCQFGDDCLFRH